MSAALDLLADLRRRGIQLEPVGDRLRWSAQDGGVTAEDLERLRQMKPELMQILAPDPAWLERRTWEWKIHLDAHDPDHATLAFARECARDDWRISLQQTPSTIQ